LWVSLALTTSCTSSASAAIARSAPRTLGTSAEYVIPGRRGICAITSSAPAIAGIADGATKEAASIRVRPVPESASMSRTRSATATGGSFWKPSRGPTSRISACAGQERISAG